MFIKSLKLCSLYCVYRDNIAYFDNLLNDSNESDMIFSISPNSSWAVLTESYIEIINRDKPLFFSLSHALL